MMYMITKGHIRCKLYQNSGGKVESDYFAMGQILYLPSNQLPLDQ